MEYLVSFNQQGKEVFYRVVDIVNGMYLGSDDMPHDIVAEADEDTAVKAVDDVVCKLAELLAADLTELELDDLSSYTTTIEDYTGQDDDYFDYHYRYGHVPAVFYEAVEDAKSAVRGL